MVAYSFQRMFVPAIETGLKRQTIRAARKRHARPGEMIQLYTGMRTKACRKIIPDPECRRVDDIEIMVGDDRAPLISMIAINGCHLDDVQMESFAHSDGFNLNPGRPALEYMSLFWLQRHGSGLFTGKLIHWNPEART